MLKSVSTNMIARGILAIIVGIIAIAWPEITVYALVILFAVYAFIASGFHLLRAFTGDRAGPVFGDVLLALVHLAVGVVALAWPRPTALVLVLVVAAWAVATGLVEFFAGFGRGETAGTRAMFIIGGLVSIAFGVILFANPSIGAVTLALLFGLFSLVYGIWQTALGIELRRTRKTLRPAFTDEDRDSARDRQEA